MERVIIYGNHKKATVAINNVDLELLEQQRVSLISNLDDHDRVNDNEGIINFLNEICDKYTSMKEHGVRALSHMLLGEYACRLYDDYGLGGLLYAIEQDDFTGYHLFHFSGDVFKLTAQMDRRNDFVWISEEEYNKLIEL
ncbi:MAG: hypothetical protein JXR54_11750 [Tannerellaceae bacterium]|nr:hypothetical protein [Tannerellaceae bacterium]